MMRTLKLLLKLRTWVEADADEDSFSFNKVSPILTQLNISEADIMEEEVEEQLFNYVPNVDAEVVLPLKLYLESGQVFFIYNFILITKLIRALCLMMGKLRIYVLTSIIFFKVSLICALLSLYDNSIVGTRLEANMRKIIGTVSSFKNWGKMFGRTINFRRKDAAKK